MSFANFPNFNNKTLFFIVFFFLVETTKTFGGAYNPVMFLDLLLPGPEGEKCS